jgi:flagellar protein FliO/FliZ
MTQYILSLLICLFSTFTYAEDAPKPDLPNVEHPPAINQETHPLDEFEVMKNEPDNFMSQLLSMAATIGVLVGLIMIMTWVLKRLLNSRIEQINSKSSIKVLETRNVSPKTAIHVVEVFGKHYVIAESVNGVTALGELTQLPPKSEFEKLMQNKNTIN